jgi:non-ribosomal peptide synthetase component F
VGVLYEAFARGEESPLAELKHQYGDYARWQRQWLTGEVLERQLEYWRKQLRGMPAVLELPTDFPRPAVPSNRGVSQPLEIPIDVFEAAKILCHQEGVTLFMVCLTALKIFLYRYSGRTDILIGSPIAGRSRGETENMIGGFVNIVLLRSLLDGDPTCRELLGRICDVTLGAYEHQDLPFAKLLEELLPGEILGNYGARSAPLFRVVFDLNNTPPGEQLKSPGLEVSLVDTDNKVTGCDVFVSMSENGKSLTGSFLYSYDLFNEDTATRMRTDFQVILRNMVENPDQELSALVQPPR